MRALRNLLFLAAVMMLGGGSAWGHHSFAMFDLEKEVTLEGVVKDLQWGNPHVWLQILTPNGKGGTTEWGLEMGTPGMLTRTGWKSSMLKPGDKVTVVGNPLTTTRRAPAFAGALVPSARGSTADPSLRSG